ncbi:MAG: sugar ABC transporter substrate-binding protein [Chloroflexota bacterium]|nr:sugar ABC transporter substrate-binding protein [Chloroflexota bacterium]
MSQSLVTRRGVLAGMLGGSGALLLAACGQATMTGEPQQEMAEKPADTKEAMPETVTLNVICYTEAQGGDYERSIAGYRAEVSENIDLSIDVTAWGEYWPKLKTSAAAGTPFDVMIMNGPNIMFHAANNILYDLSPYVKADGIDMLETFPAYLVNVYTLFGKVWGLPNFHATIGMYYNREHLGEAGLDEPAEDWTFDDWLEMSQKLTIRKGETPERWGTYVSVWGQTEGYNYVLANGGEILSKDKTEFLFGQPEGLEAFNFMHSLIHQHGVAPTRPEASDAGGKRNMFHNGLLTFRASGPWEFGHLAPLDHINWGVQYLPRNVRQANVVHGSSFAAGDQGKTPDQSWEFIKYATTSDTGENSTAEFTMPGSWKGSRNWTANNDFPELAQKFLDSMDWGFDYPQSYSTLEWNSAIPAELNKAVDNEVTMDEAVVTAVAVGNKILDEEQVELRRLGVIS